MSLPAIKASTHKYSVEAIGGDWKIFALKIGI
jgi:hypothetical protein